MSTNHKNFNQFRTLSVNRGGLPVGVLPNIDGRNNTAYEPRKMGKKVGYENNRHHLRSNQRY